MTNEYKLRVGCSTLQILHHLGFSVRLATAEAEPLLDNHVWMAIHTPENFAHDVDIAMSAGDTSVVRNVPVQDFWTDVETIMVAALSAKMYLTEPRLTV
jgi:hypothetical protein